MHVITMKSNLRDYRVSFPDQADFLGELASKPDSLFVVDSNVWQLHKEGCLKGLPESDIVVLPVSEERKNLLSVVELYDRFMDRAAKKNMTLISIGGGILQDITGFTATTLYRGINWIFIPTTLLAQADSCIGSKTSLNYKRFKNLVGTFYPPSEIFIFAPFLATLKEVDFFSGLGEVVKLHIMGGRKTTDQLIEMLPWIIKREPDALMTCVKTSLGIKRSYMEGDEFDTGRRNLLNYGHCFGHALETVSNYTIPHGQAVVIGMLFANIAAESRGILSSKQSDRLARELFLSTITEKGKSADYSYEKILEAMKKDKKRIGQGLVVVMMHDDFSFEKVTDFSDQELRTGLRKLTDVLALA
jgi:3-dehydroquinate synthase